jgi:hypothetical protein
MPVIMKAVETELPGNEQQDQYGAGQSDGQSGYIDQGKDLMITDVSKSNSKKIPPHITSVGKKKTVFMPQSLFCW